MFNPLCFVGYNPSFAALENSCNPMGGIARAIRRFTNWRDNANTIPLNTNHNGVPNMV